MASQIKAYPEEYNELKSELDKLHKSITASLSDVNSRIGQMTSAAGPLYSVAMSAKMSPLLFLLRTDLHVPATTNTSLLSKYLLNFANGLNSRDKASL